MDEIAWSVTGTYRKNKHTFKFAKELIGEKESHIRERTLSDIGSRHRIRRRDIEISEIKQLKPAEVKSLELRRRLGVESAQ
ncbi:MAG: 50S ribosomal protein L18a [Candidatus Thorarchaeota archaeon]|nr:MAG: 50S ribosomal protein L18a [Candidatus Thorarchaeota archaeon]